MNGHSEAEKQSNAKHSDQYHSFTWKVRNSPILLSNLLWTHPINADAITEVMLSCYTTKKD